MGSTSFFLRKTALLYDAICILAKIYVIHTHKTIDYISKWVEMEAHSRSKDCWYIQFVWKYIISCFSLPRVFVKDNGSQLICSKYNDFYKEWDINIRYSTPWIPQGMDKPRQWIRLLNTLIKCLKQAKRIWAYALLGVLWCYRTTIHAPVCSTPFSLV